MALKFRAIFGINDSPRLHFAKLTHPRIDLMEA
jgi:hypothetical protein